MKKGSDLMKTYIYAVLSKIVLPRITCHHLCLFCKHRKFCAKLYQEYRREKRK